MSEMVVFGAGGRAGRAVVAEARRRGHGVTAVVRDPARYPELPAEGVRVVAGDVTDAARVAELVAGHEAVVSSAAVYGAGTDPDAFFRDSTRALLGAVGDRRLVVVGLATLLPDAAGVPLLDSPVLPPESLPFCRAHGAGLEILRAEGGDVDWLYLSPSGLFDEEGPRSGRYRVADHGDLGDRISYRDLAVALLDEVEVPRHRRTQLAVTT
ncbi:NAD(P)-dependent oxidoreductase [Streptomyces hainanensis]|uniref:NAD-dependent epimerase/dehydratase family protein n=1 Tax=Streptomyces hainanensis TaxID=402648 RepID=A0A4R4SHX9_9ACTN|nr:NAD(P)H-binding protein [Streptomyces hainanensis]TDC62306.1 NAD-dependent epimerase/dehydratase family protein [Streptomyces hainanensis]